MRHDPSYPEDKLDTYANQILLCPTHHNVIDKDAGVGFPVDVVLAMKSKHEKEMDQARGPSDRRRQLLEERIVAQLSAWEQMLGIEGGDEWDGMTFGLNFAVPRIQRERFE